MLARAQQLEFRNCVYVTIHDMHYIYTSDKQLAEMLLNENQAIVKQLQFYKHQSEERLR